MGNGHTVLVVDDMAVIRDLMAASLRGAGYRALGASNGKEALELVRAEQVSLILLDLNMPVMDGSAFLHHLRGDPAYAKTPVILLSAAEAKEDVLKVAKFGVKGYLLKSKFSLKDLLARVKEQIGEPAAAAPPATAPPAVTRTTAAPTTVSPAAAAPPDTNAPPRPGTIAGVLEHVIAVASSPRGDLSQLIELVASYDGLAARVLEVANSPAYTASRDPVSTVGDAVRRIGCSGVHRIALNVAAALAETKTLPPPTAGTNKESPNSRH